MVFVRGVCVCVLVLVCMLGLASAADVPWATLTEAQLAALPPSAFASLNSTQLATIPDAACAGLTSAQMAQVNQMQSPLCPYTTCSGMRMGCLLRIPPATLPAMLSNCLQCIPQRQFNLTSSQLASMSPEQVGMLGGVYQRQITQLLPAVVSVLNASQTGSLMDPSCTWMTSAQWGALESTDAPAYRPTTCSGVTAHCASVAIGIGGVNAQCLSHMSTEVLSQIKIMSVPAATWDTLPRSVVASLPADTFCAPSHMNAESLDYLSASPHFLSALSEDCLAWISVECSWSRMEWVLAFDTPELAHKLVSNVTESCFTSIPCSVWARMNPNGPLFGALDAVARVHEVQMRCKSSPSRSHLNLYLGIGGAVLGALILALVVAVIVRRRHSLRQERNLQTYTSHEQVEPSYVQL